MTTNDAERFIMHAWAYAWSHAHQCGTQVLALQIHDGNCQASHKPQATGVSLSFLAASIFANSRFLSLLPGQINAS